MYVVGRTRSTYWCDSLPVITTRSDALVTASPSACKRSDWDQSQKWRELEPIITKSQHSVRDAMCWYLWESLSHKYQYQYQYQYQRSKYQYLACKYKYKYQYPKIVLTYRSSTSTSTQYNKTAF